LQAAHVVQEKGMKADLILSGGTVVTIDARRRVIRDGAVAILDGRIAEVGPAVDILARWDALDIRDCSGCVVMPGLVNTHTHLPMSLLRGLMDDVRLDVWLYGYMLPVEKEFTDEEFCRIGTLLSCAELIRSGVTCFADMYYYEDRIAQVAADVGLRGVCAETIMRIPTPDAASYDESLDYVQKFVEKWVGHPLITPALGPHSIYLCTPEILHATSMLGLQYDVPQLIHIAETDLEVKELVEKLGELPIVWMQKQGLLVGKMLVAHGVHLADDEMTLLGERNIGIAHNPTSNLKLASGIARVLAMRHNGVVVGIGTDGCASNNDLDMIEEMRLTALLPKGVSGDPTAIPARVALEMATAEGARALYLESQIGSLEAGKWADVIVIGLEDVHETPRFALSDENVYSQIVYAAKSQDVRDVLVAGRFLMRDRQLLTIDWPVVKAEAEAIAARVNDFLMAREENLVDKIVGIGGMEQQETFEVQVKVKISDESALRRLLGHREVNVVRESIRRQYDTYFLFNDPDKGHLRYREDNPIQPDGSMTPRYGLTLRGPTSEREYENSVILTRSRFSAVADRSLRFYREYFQPDHLKEINKERRRWRIVYKGVDFEINADRLFKPAYEELFLEIKSRTWSSKDAVAKAEMIGELLQIMSVLPEQIVRKEYVDF
jgi:5-methylthioadenosine/S-adenosylhomocysteine deaminase